MLKKILLFIYSFTIILNFNSNSSFAVTPQYENLLSSIQTLKETVSEIYNYSKKIETIYSLAKAYTKDSLTELRYQIDLLEQEFDKDISEIMYYGQPTVVCEGGIMLLRDVSTNRDQAIDSITNTARVIREESEK